MMVMMTIGSTTPNTIATTGKLLEYAGFVVGEVVVSVDVGAPNEQSNIILA